MEKANKWLNEVEFKLKTTENIPGGAEEISEVLAVSCDLIEMIMIHVMDAQDQVEKSCRGNSTESVVALPLPALVLWMKPLFLL